MDDAKLFFCPTSQGAQMYSAVDDAKSEYLNNLSQLRTIGGTSRDNWVYGDYSWTNCPALDGMVSGATGRGWQGSYNYRMQPAAMATAHYTWDIPAASAYCGAHGTVPFIKPTLEWGFGRTPNPIYSGLPGEGYGTMQPMMQTEKQCRDRATMCDSFSRTLTNASQLGSAKNNAEGLYCHKDGYNVLYGDGSLQWFGDPKQQISYWPVQNGAGATQPFGLGDETWDIVSGKSETPTPCTSNVDTTCSCVGGISGTFWHPDDYSGYNNWTYATGARNGSYAAMTIWHRFDLARGIDAGWVSPTTGLGAGF
jgi:hypothetical protein